jgi:tetratricopeptide (TPR) repeat protein
MYFFFPKIRMNFILRRDFHNHRQKVLCLAAVVFMAFSFAQNVFTQEDETEDAVIIFNQGQDAHEKGDLQAALKFYDEAIKLAPEFPEAEFQRGNALLSLGNSYEAEKAFRRAVELRDDWTLPMASLGSILVSSNRFAEAEKILTKAIELDDKNFPAYVALTDLRLKTKASPAVLKELLARLQILTSKANPTASIWASRSAVERALGDKASAKTSLNRALAIEPKNKSALIERAEIAIAEADYAGAAEIAKTLIQLSPNASDVKFLQARIFATDGKTEEALKILDSITNPPAEVTSFKNTITVDSASNVADLEKQIEQDAKNAAVLGRLCNLLRTKNPLKALEYCRRANEIEPDDLNHAVGFGAALVQAKQFETAITVFKKILQVAPDNLTARANLATAFFQLKRYAEAKAEYQWLTERQSDLSVAFYFLAIAHDNLGEYMDAMANYQQFLKLADAVSNKLEIEKVNLRLPALQKQIKSNKGKK